MPIVCLLLVLCSIQAGSNDLPELKLEPVAVTAKGVLSVELMNISEQVLRVPFGCMCHQMPGMMYVDVLQRPRGNHETGCSIVLGQKPILEQANHWVLLKPGQARRFPLQLPEMIPFDAQGVYRLQLKYTHRQFSTDDLDQLKAAGIAVAVQDVQSAPFSIKFRSGMFSMLDHTAGSTQN